MNAPAHFALVGLGVVAVLLTPGGQFATQAQTEATPEIPPRTWLPPDAFYDPPADVPADPGVLLRSEPLTDRLLPEGAQAWRIQYSTTFADGSPAVAVATVLAPADPPPGSRPVITWEHGTVGILQKCMPSLVSAPFEGIPALDQVVADGWVLVATDYAPNAQGVHPYIIGEGEARSALDATRAARQMPELTLSDETVVWGHSQGGHAALWTGIVGPRYAPDVEILGMAAIAPASNPEQILTMHGGDSSGARLGAYFAAAYSQYYLDVAFDEAVSPEARDIAREMATLCQFDPQDIPSLQALTEQLGGSPVLADPAAGALGEWLRENTPNAAIGAPVLVAQGLTDEVVFPEVTDGFVEERCVAGQSLEYWRVAGRDHGGVVAPDSPLGEPLVRWTRDRFAGMAQESGCQEKTIA